MKYELFGYNTEQLIKTLHSRKISLFNVQSDEPNKITFEVLDKDEKKVKRFIANFKIKQTLTGVKKIPKMILTNVGLIVGVFIGTIVSIFLSNFTWDIEVFGTKNLSTNEILNVLSTNGIRKGKINLTSTEDIENILLNEYDRIAQVSVIKMGTSIIVNLSEKLVYVEQKFDPITAKFNGVVTSLNIITGTCNVKVGDYVNIGDPLVLPFNINSNGERISVNPMAEIIGEIFVVSKCEMKKFDKRLVRTGETQTTYSYKLGNLNLFSGRAKNSFAIFEFDVYNERVSNLIPFSRDVYKYYELKTISVEHDFEKEKDNLVEMSAKMAYESLPVGEIMSESTDVTIVNDVMFACTTIKILGKIND